MRYFVAIYALGSLLFSADASHADTFTITYRADSADAQPLDGRVLLMLSTSDDDEPRFQITHDLNSQQVFGIDVEGWKPDEPAVLGPDVFGHPKPSIDQVPPGTYWVQALLHRYETFNRADGHTVKLPMDRGEGQQWNKAPGNLFSKPVKITFHPNGRKLINVELTEEIPPIEPPPVENGATKYIKHIRIQSEKLTKFWGRPMHLGAHVLLPEGFEEHPDARYPLVIFHGHFPPTFRGFRPEPPDADLESEYSERFQMDGYNRLVQQTHHDFYKLWTDPQKKFPRVILVEIQHANPYYDDSYAVNSANVGPYGDAITHELVPAIEKQFRGLGTGWSRFLYGGSTGGWEALAAQVFYPDEYNGCYAACPDPIDFRAYTVFNLYESQNAYFDEGPFAKVARPAHRNYLGQVNATVESSNHYELALGTKGRSGQQWDIWQAVYSPVGDDGYPKPIWDKRSGEIDHEVAEHWRENYDLSHILRRDWAKLGPKLRGKIHIYCGDMDNYYLNNAVYLTEDFLRQADPPFEGEVTYGDRAEHCWNGDPDQPNAISRLRYNQMFIPRIAERILKTAPEGGDTESWRY